MTIGRDLAELRLPVPVDMGGTGKTTEFRKGFIDGFRLVYTGRQSLTISAGAAYIQALGEIVEMAADKVLTALTLSASAFHHVYLFRNASGVGDIELSTTAPVGYYGTGYSKTGDNTRRYLGSVLASSTSAFWGFIHHPARQLMLYTEGSPGSAPFMVYSGINTTTPTLISTASAAIAPKETVTGIVGNAAGAGTARYTTPDQISSPTAGGANWRGAAGGTAGSAADVTTEIPVSRAAATLGQFYVWAGLGSITFYANGYYFER